MGEGYRRGVVGQNPEVLKMLKELYTSGVNVVCEKVDGIKHGTKGVVKNVRDNGDIVVYWETGRQGVVVYGKDSISVEMTEMCILHKTLAKNACDKKKCATCGWNQKENKRRLKRIYAGDLSVDENGLRYLAVRTK